VKGITNTRTLLFLILLSSFAVRIALILWFKTYASPVPWEYETIADNLLAGRGYSFEYHMTTYWSFNTPLFGLLSAAVYYFTNHSFVPILLIQSFFSMCLARVIFAIGRNVFDEKVGLLAAAATAFHPGFVYYDVINLLPLSIDSFLIALATFFWLKFRSYATLRQVSLIGVVIGIALLSRGITGMLLPLVADYYLLLAKPARLSLRLRNAACLFAACFIVLSPWLIRNYRVQGQFVFIASSSAENLWRGNNPYATGTSTDEHAVPIFRLMPSEFQQQVYSRNELQQQEFFQKEALSFIRERPLDAAILYASKVYYFWWFSPQSGLTYKQKHMTVYKFGYSTMLVFAAAGFVLAIRSPKPGRRESCLMMLSVAVVICLGQSVFYVEGRHRWLIEPLLLIFFSFGVFETWEFLKSRLMNFRNPPSSNGSSEKISL
jgi:4-amino-4-deoxy-L-arabinose transferase-like glycosyltransferase